MKNPTSPNLNVTLAGVPFRSPIGVGAIGAHWGKAQQEPKVHAEINSEILIKHVRAGAGYIILAGMFLTEATERMLLERSRMDEVFLPPSDGHGMRMIKAEAEAPYGVEGFYFVPSPFWLGTEFAKHTARGNELMMEKLLEKKPSDVPIIANCLGVGDLPEAWVDGAKRWEELGADLIEINVSCPIALGLGGSVDNFFQKRFPPLFQGALVGDQPDLVEEIVRKVVGAVKIPVGVKLSPETGFPRIVGLAKTVRDAGAKFVHVFNAAVGIAPPDIYNEGRPSWPYMDGSPFCMASGSFLRIQCYRDVAAIARYVPGIDIAAAGGLVSPRHCVEAMMLGATLTQLCTGVIEQGRSLIRQSQDFLKKFMVEQGYGSLEQIIGLGQRYIKNNEDVDMMKGKTAVVIDPEKCTKCGRCLDNICTALYSEKGKIKIREERCAGCGGCMIACRSDAIRFVLKE